MIESFATVASPVLSMPIVRRIRRNHGLEHATIHLLSKKIRNLKMAGRADTQGFLLYGDAETELIRTCVTEALHRMQNGDHMLAVHPNCGTGLVTTGLMTSMAAIIGLRGARETFEDSFNRLPLVMLLTIGAPIVSQPIGLSLQQHITTLGDPGDLELVDVTKHEVKTPFSSEPMTVHRVRTRLG